MLFAGLILMLPHQSHAAIIFDTRDTGTSTVLTSSQMPSSGNANGYFLLGQSNATRTTQTFYYGVTEAAGQNGGGGYCTDTAITASTAADGDGTGDYAGFGTSNQNNSSVLTYVTGTVTMNLDNGAYYFVRIPNNHTIGGSGNCVTSVNATGTFGGYQSNYWLGSNTACLADDPTSCSELLPPPSPSPTIAFQYPVLNSSTYPFSNFLLSLNNLTSTDNYNGSVNINYYLNNGSGTYAGSRFCSTSEDIQGVTSSLMTVAQYSGNNLVCINTATPNVTPLNATSVIAEVTGNLLDITIPGIITNVAQATSSYIALIAPNGNPILQIQGIGTSTIISTSSLNLTINPVLPNASSTYCPLPTSDTDLGGGIYYGLCQFGYALFTPNTNAGAYLQNSVNNFENVPPFSGVFLTYKNLTSAISSTPASQDLDYNLTLGDGTYLVATYTIPFLTSSTMEEGITPAGKTILFNLEDAMFDLLTLAVLFYVPWHWWRRKQSIKISDEHDI